MDTVAMQYHIGRLGVSSLSPGDQIYPSFAGYSSKEWVWNCWFPSVRDRKSNQHHLSIGGILPCSRWGCRQTVDQNFSFPVRLNLFLQAQALYTSLPVLPPRRGRNLPGVDLMASLPDIQLLTIKTLLASDATKSGISVTFWNASQAKSTGENISHLSDCAQPWVCSWLR